MSENVGSIYISLDLDSKNFKSGLSAARSEANKFTGSLNDYFNDSVATSKKLTAGLLGLGTALSASVIGFAKIAGNMESARQGFVNLLGSAEKADDIIKTIKKDAAETPFELPGLIQANLLLSSVTKNGQRSERILLDVGKALAAAGKGQAELDRVILNLQQIGMTGQITAMDLRQFGYAGINVLELLGEYYGTTANQAKEMAQNSSDAFGDLEKAFAKAGGAGGRFEKSFILQAGTFNQLVSNMKDSIGIFGSDVLKQTGVFDELKNAMAKVIDWLKDNKDVIADSIVDGLKWIKDNGAVVAGIISGILAPAVIKSVGDIALSMGKFMPWILIFTLLAIGVKKLIDHYGGLDKTIKAFTDFMDTRGKPVVNALKLAWQGLEPSVRALWNTIEFNLLPAFRRLWNELSPVLLPALRDVAIGFGGLLYAAIWLIINALNIFSHIVSFNTDLWIRWRHATLNNIANVVDFFKDTVSVIRSIFSRVYDGITAPFRAAFNWIINSVDAVKRALDKLNPFHRESPSLVDYVTTGTDRILNEYSTMFNKLNELATGVRPQLVTTGMAASAGAASISTSIYGGISINNRADADYLLSRISYNDDIVSRGLSA